ncbi:MAG: hypothetical protein RIT11_757 [Pseudomonadota bacterium]|jgi:hypothetical protein
MEKYRVQLISVNNGDNEGLKELQKKINQWMTTGLMVKYEIHASSDQFLFNILLKKEA